MFKIMRKVRFTQKQIEECLMHNISEGTEAINLKTVNFDNMTVARSAEVAKGIASQNNGTNVTLNGEEIKATDNAAEKAQDIIDTAKETANGSISEHKCFTKKQLKESKLKHLKENSVSIKKKDLFK